MLSLRNKRAMLRALGRKVPLGALPHVQPIFLLQTVIGLSQILNEGAAQSEAMARALILDGQQRLRRLSEAAPHLDLSLEHLLRRIRQDETVDEQLSDEESAVQAVLQMCLGVLLYCLYRADPRMCLSASSIATEHLPSFAGPNPRWSSSPEIRFRARSCLIP